MYVLYSYSISENLECNKTSSRKFDTLHEVMSSIKDIAKYTSSTLMLHHIIEFGNTKLIDEIAIWSRSTEEFLTIWNSNRIVSAAEECYSPQEIFNILAHGISSMSCTEHTRETVKAGLRFLLENFPAIAFSYRQKSEGSYKVTIGNRNQKLEKTNG